jgi:DNA-binding transcriptional ArsR family regulator
MANRRNVLNFACECVSGTTGGYSEPWAAIAKNKLLPNGTKEDILNLLAKEPKTISQLATALGLSAPSIHTHVREMLASELLRETVERAKAHPAERYYEPNFPVIDEAEAAELCELCGELAEKMAALITRHHRQLENAFHHTSLASRGWTFPDVAQYVFASVQRGARELLEQNGTLASPKTHQNGIGWIFWAKLARKNTRDQAVSK